ncbi:Hypothetical_protein [Hexamita inflata]|uniref:Hypothetical_protein n=1 Tax=Hexamita inflata TaxID=28002 RepID=A0AA86TS88_9EUKA|nr:Hypothetical protein HINF_LOCUS14351 [Hexamita inflata]CAI9926708.1 Hypothetical protein HINF_LOCUS14353 [Hexamita inflata]CAI9926711.1 Hypothetical protein HINF_LOCUS14356 [Hexamita inflata]
MLETENTFVKRLYQEPKSKTKYGTMNLSTSGNPPLFAQYYFLIYSAKLKWYFWKMRRLWHKYAKDSIFYATITSRMERRIHYTTFSSGACDLQNDKLPILFFPQITYLTRTLKRNI